ncbi:hypothetical protein NA56DRAFT_712861 [Hyaloscypha hepaticicola]|uniref:4Fe-4S ferredoxin-type domain-containing protein n=1 Tax=Hyaloscypha hepaticicola TaxID=2082293 RepID=A0A2J6PF66_9HELO|nr:hypothetical protein NA56DRAFT_712861 [Hyaloscypha hepaticicola]
MIICNDTCVDPLLDPNNCFSCGISCDSAICLFGRCFDCPDDSSGQDVCASGTNPSDAFCTDFSTDAQKCGGCGNVCSSGQCNAGACCISPTLPAEKSASILLTTWITADIVTSNALSRIIIAEGNASNVILSMATGCAILQALASSIAATSRTILKIAEIVIMSAILDLA